MTFNETGTLPINILNLFFKKKNWFYMVPSQWLHTHFHCPCVIAMIAELDNVTGKKAKTKDTALIDREHHVSDS